MAWILNLNKESSLSGHECSRFVTLIVRRWSSRRFPYGYLVTTSPQSWTIPWWAAPRRLAYPLLVQITPMVWRAVCTRPENVFTATCWFAITSDSNFMESSCRLQSGLRAALTGLAPPCGLATLCTAHCSTCVALLIKAMMTWHRPHLPPVYHRQSP